MSQRYKAGQKPNLRATTLLQWYKKAPNNLLNFTWYSASEHVEEPWGREMTTVPSSTC